MESDPFKYLSKILDFLQIHCRSPKYDRIRLQPTVNIKHIKFES